MLCRDRYCANHVHVLPRLYLALSPEFRNSGTAARPPAWMFFMVFAISIAIFTLIHSALLEISDVDTISNSRFPVLPRGFFLRGRSGEMAKNVTLLRSPDLWPFANQLWNFTMQLCHIV